MLQYFNNRIIEWVGPGYYWLEKTQPDWASVWRKALSLKQIENMKKVPTRYEVEYVNYVEELED